MSAEASETLQYYTPEIHKAAFVLPKFMQKKLKDAGVGW